MKYIDPAYMVSAVAANVADNLYCTLLAHSTVAIFSIFVFFLFGLFKHYLSG